MNVPDRTSQSTDCLACSMRQLFMLATPAAKAQDLCSRLQWTLRFEQQPTRQAGSGRYSLKAIGPAFSETQATSYIPSFERGRWFGPVLRLQQLPTDTLFTFSAGHSLVYSASQFNYIRSGQGWT